MVIPSLSIRSVYKQVQSSHRAYEKVNRLEAVLSRYYPQWPAYDGKSAIADVPTALKYVVAKKRTKGDRKAAGAAATAAFTVAGTVIGGAAGSVALPGAGSVVGALTVGQIVGSAPGVGTQLMRKSKFLYKTLRGTQGVHRQQAAGILYQTYKDMQNRPIKIQQESKAFSAANEALRLILDDPDEFAMVTQDQDIQNAVKCIASRLKSW